MVVGKETVLMVENKEAALTGDRGWKGGCSVGGASR